MNTTSAAVILAGGRGSRLGGVDKATIAVDGVTQLDRLLAATADALERIVVGPASATSAAAHRSVRESPPFGGPALALRAGVDALATSPDVVDVLAVDLRHPAQVAALLATWTPHPDTDGALLVIDGRPQYLAARIRLDPLRRALATVAPGESLRRAYAPLRLDELAAPSALAADFDTLDDIRDGGASIPLAPRIGATMATLPEGLDTWNEHCATALGLDPAEVPLETLLSTTGVVAHSVVRPAAPITSFLVGLAAGRGTVPSVEAGLTLARELAQQWERAAGVESGE